MKKTTAKRVESETTLKNVPAGKFGIGTAAKLTGISVHTLRAWEKRYQVVDLARSSTGRRLYSASDVTRLQLLKQLVQTGHTIGNIAALENSQLRMMLALDVDEAENDTRINVCILNVSGTKEHLTLPDAYKRDIALGMETTEFVPLRDMLTGGSRYAVLISFATIQKHQLQMLRLLKNTEARHRYFVVYNFAHRDIIDELSSWGFHLLRAPITNTRLFEKILSTCRQNKNSSQLVSEEDVPPHRFTKKQLEAIAGLPSAVSCECPQHLIELIRSLTRFEVYCQQCVASNKEDARLHNEIYQYTAQARGQLEKAIDAIVRAENINLNTVNEK